MNVDKKVNLDQFNKDIKEVMKDSNRSTDEMLKYVMILMLQAGRSATKVGDKKRKLKNEKGQEEEFDDGLGHNADDGSGMSSAPKRKYFEVYKQGRGMPHQVFLPIIPRKRKKNMAEREAAIQAKDAIINQFKVIKYRGVAKASWGWAMGLLNAKVSLNDKSSELANSVRRIPLEIKKTFDGFIRGLEVTNKLGWIRKIVPGIEQKMINSANARMRKWLEMRWQRAIDKAERKTV
jgi:hypothetical protein